jgi:hypothetical protein
MFEYPATGEIKAVLVVKARHRFSKKELVEAVCSLLNNSTFKSKLPTG